jgi:hypothetical protein
MIIISIRYKISIYFTAILPELPLLLLLLDVDAFLLELPTASAVVVEVACVGFTYFAASFSP